jgi:hypothetical protein
MNGDRIPGVTRLGALAVALLAASAAAGCAAPVRSGERAPRAVCADESRSPTGGPALTGPMARFFLFCVQTQ